MKLNDCEIGDVISFKYNGGSRPGGMRIVKITGVDKKYITGIDLDINESRTFRFDRASDVTYLEVKEQISFVNARQSLKNDIDRLTIEGLANIVKISKSLPTYADKEGNIIIYAPSEKPPKDGKVEINNYDSKYNRCNLNFTNKLGNVILFDIDALNNVIFVDGERMNPKEAINTLSDFFDEVK